MNSERDPLWDGLRELAKQNHRERVAKTPSRIAYAERRLAQEGIRYEVKNHETGHFHAWSEHGTLFQFWASTGKILGRNQRGIENFIKLVHGTHRNSKMEV